MVDRFISLRQLLGKVRANRQTLRGYGVALLAVMLVTPVIGLLGTYLTTANGLMLYLLVVLGIASIFGVGPAVLASFAAVFTFDWCCVSPLGPGIADPTEWVALYLFLATALVAGQLAGRLHRRTEEARRRERAAVLLYEIGKLLNGPQDPRETFKAVAARLRAEFNLTGCAVLLADPRGRLQPVAVEGDFPAEPAQAMAAAVYAQGRPATYLSSPAHPGRWIRLVGPVRHGLAVGPANPTFLVPLRAGDRVVGVLGLSRRSGEPPFSRDEDWAIAGVAHQLAQAVERARLQEEAIAADVLRQADELKTTLLHSVSHNLRTPLAAIKAAAGSLLQADLTADPTVRQELVLTIDREVDRLNRIIENLLDMSRLEAGVVRPNKQLYPLADLVNDVVGRMRPLAADHRVVVDVPEDIPPVPLDYVQVDQVLSNLLENAFKYAPPGTEVRVTARQVDGAVRVSIIDHGPGIPPEEQARVFDRFYRGARGIGLGLAVARGLVEAHGGKIWAETTPGGGATVSFTLPLAASGIPGASPLGVR